MWAGVAHARFWSSPAGVSHARFWSSPAGVSHARFWSSPAGVSHARFWSSPAGVSHARFWSSPAGVSHARPQAADRGPLIMPAWTIAAVQMDFRLGAVADNRRRVCERLREAAARGARLVVFPECALTGYG